MKIKEEPVSDITFPISEELEGDLASGDQSLPVGVLGGQSERFSANLEVEASPQTSGRGLLLLLEVGRRNFVFFSWKQITVPCDLVFPG